MLMIGSYCGGYASERANSDIDLIATIDELNKLTRDLRALKFKVLSIPLGPKKTVLEVIPPYINRKGGEFPGFGPQKIDVEIAWPDSSGWDLFQHTGYANSYIKGHVLLWEESDLRVAVAGLDLNYTLKMSHRYLRNSPHFWKTRADIFEMRKNGAKIVLPNWFHKREAETYWYSHPSLKQSKADFFSNDSIVYVYDHDSIHEAMAHLSVPAYKLYMKDGTEVQTDKDKFYTLRESSRLYGVLEEVQVLALERSQIPYPHVDPKKSFDMALMKVCTSITSGWFREFAWDNANVIQDMYEPDYVVRFHKAVKDGIVKPFLTKYGIVKL